MKKYSVYPNAPITEALIDIRIESPKNVTLEKLENVFDSIKDTFPIKKQSLTCSTGFTKSSNGNLIPIPPSEEINGFHFTTQDGKKIVQFRLDGFTFNKLKPYENWDNFRDEGKELWNLYFEIVKPIKIIRIALRYINQIGIPLPFKNLEEYILTLPKMAPNIPPVSNFFIQLTVPNAEIESTAIIIQTIKGPLTTEKLPFILDIDVFKLQTYTENNSQMWDEFEKLRIFKNDIFLNILTDKTKELFK